MATVLNRPEPAEHEEYNRTLALLVEIVAEERGIDIRRFGSTIWYASGCGRKLPPMRGHARSSLDARKRDPGVSVTPLPDSASAASRLQC
jgi:hypothetical protein